MTRTTRTVWWQHQGGRSRSADGPLYYLDDIAWDYDCNMVLQWRCQDLRAHASISMLVSTRALPATPFRSSYSGCTQGCAISIRQRIGLVTRLRTHTDETRTSTSRRNAGDRGVNTSGVAFVTMIALRSVCDNEQ